MIAEATEDGTIVYALPWTTCVGALTQRPDTARALAQLFREGGLEERRLLSALAFSGVKTRLAQTLLRCIDQNSSRTVRETREHLAAMVGSRPEEVTKVLREFKLMGLVSYPPHGRSVFVVNPEELRTC